LDLVLATKNKKKIEEVERIVRGLGISLSTPADVPGCPEVEEDGLTFEENAVKKAASVAGWTGRTALADDSGLEVYALGGAPGVRSARYAGAGGNGGKNLEKLLEDMRSFQGADRGARFVCCLALADPGGPVKTFWGQAEGRIGMEPRGSNGFGYDPVFYPEGHSRTFAEMRDEEKDALSHRGMALRNLAAYLREAAGR
jgi:XTP/dITP diphosphohydrolase